MKVTFIKVSMLEGKSYDAMKPLIFSVIDAITPADVEIEYIDDRIEPLPKEIHSDVIALSVETFAARRAYRIAEAYKTAANRIVMGGFHVSAVPDEALEHCDTVLIGDAEETWPLYLEDLGNGREKSRYVGENRSALPKMDLNSKAFDGKKYLRLGLVQFSRGCKFQCDFCSVNSFYACHVRQKSMDLIVEEIRSIKEKILFFIDDNIFLNERTALELFAAVKPLKKKWACQISMDVAMNDRLLRAMRESGCILVLIGFESLNAENLRQMNKVANLRMQTYEEAIRNIYKHRLMIYATFVLGYDQDTPEAVEATMRFAIKHHFAAANFNPLIPMPGTNLYARLEREGKLLYPKWWLEPGYRYGDTTFLPARMTPEQLSEGCMRARYEFHTWKNIGKRLFGGRVYAHPIRAAVFLILNIVSRKEIHRKQGKVLGGET